MFVLFMGDECSVCHSEIPPLAKTIKALRSGHGALARLARVSWLFVGDAGFPQVRGTDETGAL